MKCPDNQHWGLTNIKFFTIAITTRCVFPLSLNPPSSQKLPSNKALCISSSVDAVDAVVGVSRHTI